MVRRLLPVARTGLAGVGVDLADADPWLNVIAERAEVGMTGSAWQRRMLGAGDDHRGRASALAEMTRAYLDRSATGEPVHRWGLDGSTA